MTDDAYAAHLARRRSRDATADETPATATKMFPRSGTSRPSPPPGFEFAIDPHDPYANGGEQPWEIDAPMVPKLRRIGSAGKVRAAGDGLGEWNPYTGRFE